MRLEASKHHRRMPAFEAGNGGGAVVHRLNEGKMGRIVGVKILMLKMATVTVCCYQLSSLALSLLVGAIGALRASARSKGCGVPPAGKNKPPQGKMDPPILVARGPLRPRFLQYSQIGSRDRERDRKSVV